MPNSLLRPLLILEFLVAIDAVFTLWSEVGGQYDLDLMFWAWKLGIGLGAAWLVVGVTAALVRNDGAVNRRVLFLSSLLITLFILAGLVTWYYHLNEPADDDEDNQATRYTTEIVRPELPWKVRPEPCSFAPSLPGPA